MRGGERDRGRGEEMEIDYNGEVTWKRVSDDHLHTWYCFPLCTPDEVAAIVALAAKWHVCP